MANPPITGNVKIAAPSTPIYLSVLFPLVPNAPKVVYTHVFLDANELISSDQGISNHPLGNGAQLAGQTLRIISVMADANDPVSGNEIDYQISGSNGFLQQGSQVDNNPTSVFDYSIDF